MSGIITKVTSGLCKFGAKVSQKSPALLVGGGSVLVLTGTVLAATESFKAGKILEEHREAMGQIKEAAELAPEDYSARDRKKDTTLVYAQTTGKFIKLYFPAFACEVAGITCILAGFNILRRRNAVLTAAYAELLKTYNNYRGKVIEKYGEDADKEILYSGADTEVEVDKDGEVVGETKVAGNRTDCSEYARFFDPSCPNWTSSPEYNIEFLLTAEKWFNDRLDKVGSVLLHEVYDYLGFERTPGSCVVGWKKDNPDGDGYISFGIYNPKSRANRRFINGLENVILLDFNVDGVIYHDIHTPSKRNK